MDPLPGPFSLEWSRVASKCHFHGIRYRRDVFIQKKLGDMGFERDEWGVRLDRQGTSAIELKIKDEWEVSLRYKTKSALDGVKEGEGKENGRETCSPAGCFVKQKCNRSCLA